MRCYEFDHKIRLGRESTAELLPGLESSLPSLSSLTIAGVDEAGRGPLAGPVVAAAVVLSPSPKLQGLRDSKALSEKQRESLFVKIEESALAFAVSIVDNQVIDSINILAASLQAMRNALKALSLKPHVVLVDGNQKPGSGFPERTIIKGDGLSACIMAASILAKVTRDRLMKEAHERFPMYGFHEHKGYGSKRHLDALREHGPCPLHRMTFDPVRAVVNKESALI